MIPLASPSSSSTKLNSQTPNNCPCKCDQLAFLVRTELQQSDLLNRISSFYHTRTWFSLPPPRHQESKPYTHPKPRSARAPAPQAQRTADGEPLAADHLRAQRIQATTASSLPKLRNRIYTFTLGGEMNPGSATLGQFKPPIQSSRDAASLRTVSVATSCFFTMRAASNTLLHGL
ncbi:uncharacterized protein M421DRAFT_259339 [Didymella exigua CBS 183.55]|uniref:Uncharacterized protein n=1 Tax=Didymella exigua CBS 183.55 TaxID=1150837 RepID=A0A6A5RCV3_9PLEO|nr:uncharacterized protein M421DRAFT_259339 [Didymella exigua CBS 183.55]KAF1925323.1 hypothetical protein M421DRAFT_259339 [Didymella exigua CBS 183.55]